MEWDGKIERRNNSEDHDLLIEIHQIVKNFGTMFQEHKEDDRRNFKILFEKTGSLQKFMWLAMGGLVGQRRAGSGS